MLFKNIKNFLICFVISIVGLSGLLYLIIKDSDIAFNDTQSAFNYAIKVKDGYEEVDKIVERAELNVNLMVDNIADSYDIRKQKSEAYNLNYVNSNNSLVRSALANSPGVDGAWFQLNANLPFSAHAYNWFEFNENQFVNVKEQFEDTPVNDRELTPEEDPYYFSAVETQKMTWSEIYEDTDTKKRMMTVSAPAYKNGILVGVAGVDISVDNLQQALGNVQEVLGYSEIYLADKDDKVILSQLLFGPNLVKVDYPFAELFKEHPGGPIVYVDKFVKKTAIELTLSNGYKLIVVLSDNTLYQGTNQIFTVSCVTYALLLIFTLIFFFNQFMMLMENRPKPNIFMQIEKEMYKFKKKKGYEIEADEKTESKKDEH